MSGRSIARSSVDVKLDIDLAAAACREIFAKLLRGALIFVPAERREQHDGIGHATLAVALDGVVRKRCQGTANGDWTDVAYPFSASRR